jgi:N-methylhydantoinase B
VPWGIFGGTDGVVGKTEIYNAARPGEVVQMPSKFSGHASRAGDVMAYYSPCGGGYGNPLERSAEQVREDVLDDFCTIEHARDVYGVILDERVQLDVQATIERRAQLLAHSG